MSWKKHVAEKVWTALKGGSKKPSTITSVPPSVGKGKLHKDMAKSKITMLKEMGKTQKKFGIDKYKEKGGEKIYKKILKIDPGKP